MILYNPHYFAEKSRNVTRALAATKLSILLYHLQLRLACNNLSKCREFSHNLPKLAITMFVKMLFAESVLSPYSSRRFVSNSSLSSSIWCLAVVALIQNKCIAIFRNLNKLVSKGMDQIGIIQSFLFKLIF